MFPVVLRDTSLSSYRRKQVTRLSCLQCGRGTKEAHCTSARKEILTQLCPPGSLWRREKDSRKGNASGRSPVQDKAALYVAENIIGFRVPGEAQNAVWGTVKLFGIMRGLSLKGGPPVWNQGVLEGPSSDAQGLQAVKRCTGKFW